MAADLDQLVAEFRHRRLDEAGPFAVVATDALTMKVREGGRVVSTVALVATGVNADGRREVLGLRTATSETGPARNEFFADLVARGLAALPHPLRREPDVRDAEKQLGGGHGDAPQRL